MTSTTDTTDTVRRESGVSRFEGYGPGQVGSVRL
jgi:hypothetical protein